MANLVSWLLIVGLLAGQLLRVPVAGQAIPWLDLIVGVILVLALGHLWRHRLWSQVGLSPASGWLVAWGLVWLLSLAIGSIHLGWSEILPAFLYWARLASYLVCSILVVRLWPQIFTISWWVNLFIGFAIIGMIQLFLFPDLQIFEHLGWDPHRERLVSSFLDPNFAAMWLSMGAGLMLTLLVVARYRSWDQLRLGISTIGLLVAIILTASRSGILGLAATVLVIGFWRMPRLALIAIVAIGLAVGLVPELNAKVAGVWDLDTTTRYRLESWEAGLNLAYQNPLVGVGYNTLSSTRYDGALPGTAILLSQFGNQLGSSLVASHATTGFDSSLLTIIATTGILGLLAFLWAVYGGIRSAWYALRHHSSTLAQQTAIWFLATTASLVIGSLFVNAWLYAPILLSWLILYNLVTSSRHAK